MTIFDHITPETFPTKAIVPCLFAFLSVWVVSHWSNILNTFRVLIGAQEKAGLTQANHDSPLQTPKKAHVEGAAGTLQEYPPVEPLAEFKWEETEPIQLRPFKPKYHLTMSISNSTASDLLTMDKNYLQQITLRRELVEKHPDTVLGISADARAGPAVAELYSWLFTTYLPTRYPRMFQLPFTSTNTLVNLVTNEQIPLQPPTDPLEALRTLCIHIDEDFLFLLPHHSGDGVYALYAFNCAFANGFLLREKLGHRLREIHKPVPGYKEKLEMSMDRYFSSIPVGKFVKRSNWGISTAGNFFAAFDGTHGYQTEGCDKEDIDMSNVHVRCELQSLHRLPKNKAVIFAFHTYMYPIAAMKEDGTAQDLVEAIKGLDQGNVPGMAKYKRRHEWAGMIVDFLQS